MGFVLHQRGSAQPSHTNQGSYSTNMSFWQENYAFIKEVYEMRHLKMAEWMENVEKSISRIMADKVYTSSEFKRERDTFNSLCKDLERAEVRKWLSQILEILMAERAKEQKATEFGKLDTLVKKHEELIPNVQKTAVMVDLYWKCYAYGDELKPHVEFLDGIMLSSTREIAPSCIENVDELIERQEKSLSQLLSLQNKYKITEARFEYGEMNITKLNQRIDDIEDEIYREKLKIKKCSDELNDTFDDMLANY